MHKVITYRFGDIEIEITDDEATISYINEPHHPVRIQREDWEYFISIIKGLEE